MQHLNEIKQFLHQSDLHWREGENMSLHTSFRIGGEAAVFIEPSSKTKLSALLKQLSGLQLEPVIIGRGSNLLVNDHGIDAPVICIGERFSDIWLQEPPQGITADGQVVVYAQSGASLTKLCKFCMDEGLTGLEFAYGIPGTVGGAICMNAGAYGGEMKDVVMAVEHLTMAGKEEILSGKELEFSYRHSYYSDHPCCISGGYFALAPGEKKEIRKEMDENMRKRQSKQPLEFPSAGSTFKRPEGNYASALIDQCGLKGVCVGGAQVSQKHAGFVINTGGATANDVLQLVQLIQKTVYDKTGYQLEYEIKIL